MRKIDPHLSHKGWLAHAALAVCATTSLLLASGVQAADERPNIVLLVADDVGFSDFPRFGGEAKTPMMDGFADSGMTLTNFHVLPTCSPSRSAFLTGVDNHLNGMGTMQGQLGNPANAAQVGNPGYTGYLNKRAITTATLLKDNGYNTYMTGKWHLGEEKDVEGGQTLFPRGWWPTDRGFQRSYGVLEGGGEHYGSCERAEGHCTRFFENDKIITASIPGDYFSSSANMDKALEFIDADRKENTERKPFFFYFADTMAHEPNQVPAEYIKQENIDAYYNLGWDGMRAQRISKMKDAGLIPESLAIPKRLSSMPDWNDETDANWAPLMAQVTTAPYDVMWGITTVDDLKKTLAKKMAAYTGMIEYFDDQVARLVAHLKSIGEYDNTVFIYFSDNGGDARPWDIIDRDYMLRRGVNNTYANIGLRDSFVANGPGWAQVANTPLYGSKITMGQAGIRVPLVISHPGGKIKEGSKSETVTTLTDIGATVLSYAKVEHPVGTGVAPNWDACTGTYKDQTGVCPINGKDLSGLLHGDVDQVHKDEPLGFELFGVTNKALFLEGADKTLWKILRLEFLGYGNRLGWGEPGSPEPWRLFNLTADPAESNDLGKTHPEKLQQMIAMYKQYESNVDVVSVIPNATVKLEAGDDSSEGDKSIVPGTTTIHKITVSNATTAEDTFTVSCVSDWTCALTAIVEQSTGMAGRTTADAKLAAGASATYELAITVPSSAGKGEKNVARVNVVGANTPEGPESLTVVTTAAEKPAVVASNDNGGGLSTSPFFLLLMLGLLVPGLRSRIS